MRIIDDRDETPRPLSIEEQKDMMSLELNEMFECWFEDLTLEQQRFYREHRVDITEDLRNDYL